MTINKNFVVKNGFEVNTDLILANSSTKNVGIGSTAPRYKLDVVGGIGATSAFISGVTTTNNLVVNGTIRVSSSVGTVGNHLVSTGVGVTWISPRVSTVYTATAGQTSFTVKYTVGLVDVYVNGIRLIPAEFTATSGTSVVLNDACFGGETVELVVYSTI